MRKRDLDAFGREQYANKVSQLGRAVENGQLSRADAVWDLVQYSSKWTDGWLKQPGAEWFIDNWRSAEQNLRAIARGERKKQMDPGFDHYLGGRR